MRKSIGLLACTILAAAILWITGHAKFVAAGLDGFQPAPRRDRASASYQPAPRELSARELLQRGRIYLRQRRYVDAITALEDARSASGALTLYERRQLARSLRSARIENQRAIAVARYRAAADSPPRGHFDVGVSGGPFAQAAPRSAPPAATSLAPEQKKIRVRELLKAAQADVRDGLYAQARQKIDEAKQYHVEYGPFDIRPAHVESDLARAKKLNPLPEIHPASRVITADAHSPAGGSVTNPFARSPIQPVAGTSDHGVTIPRMDSAAVQLTKRQQAKHLIRDAQRDLNAGHFAEARNKALKARDLGVTWDLFEMRPKHVLAEIDRLAGTRTYARSNPATRPPVPSAGPTPPPAAFPGTGPKTNPFASSSRPKNDRKQQATRLIADARRDMQAGRFDAARDKLHQAANLKVTYTLFEDRPELLLENLEQKAASAALAKKSSGGSPPAIPSTGSIARTKPRPPAATDPNRQKSDELVRQARADLKQGRIKEAQRKALAAQQLKVAYSIFDDRPELVLQQIGKMAGQPGSAASIARTKPRPPAATDPNRQKSDELVRQARADLKQGRIKEARRKALAAQQLKVAYSIFDDRPELVLQQIGKMAGQPGSAASIARTKPPAGSGSARNPFGPSQTAARTTSVASAAGRTAKQRAVELLRQARIDLSEGRVELARRKTLAAKKLNVTFGVFEDRPADLLAAIDRMSTRLAVTSGSTASGSASGKSPVTTADVSGRPRTSGTRPLPGVRNPIESRTPRPSDVSVVYPEGGSALEYYNRGVEAMRAGRDDDAYHHFLQAYQSGQKLDPYRARQLQSFLRDLSPRRRKPSIRLTSGTRPGAIDIVQQRNHIKFEKLRNETLNAAIKADRLKERDRTDDALRILDAQIAKVMGSDLNKRTVAPLLRRLNRSRTDVQSYARQRAPLIGAKQRKGEVEAAVRRHIDDRVRVDQEFARLVEDYNKLFKQRRYAEAEVVAKQAKELDPENPVGETMFWKARFGKRIQRDDKTKLGKEDSFVRSMQDIDDDVINPVIDSPIHFIDKKKWDKLTKRRAKYGQPSNRIPTEEERRIRKSLERPVSLHFEKANLTDVVKHIRTIANVNVVLDSLGLEEEGVTSDTPVTIDVDGIKLKSALNLMLEPLNLSYLIKDEVLQITSRMRQQGELRVETYPVADLVVPIPNFPGAGGGLPGSSFMRGGNPGFGAAGGTQTAAGPQFQVNDPLGAGAGIPGNTANSPRVAGGASVDFDTLSSLITATIEPSSWDEVGGPGSVQSFETTLSLVIRQTEKVHEEIRDLLEQLRRLQDLQVTIEVRFITVSDSFFERIGVDFDFNVQDNVGADSKNQGQFGTPGLFNQNQNQNQGGGGQNQNQNQGGQNQNQQQQQQGAQGFFTPPPQLNLPNLDSHRGVGTVVGLSNPGTFTDNLDVQFKQGSFQLGVPQFGNFNPDAGIQVGLAILSDIEAFFFIQAAQADKRSNLMFAPKVTLFNGQIASVSDIVQRPFVTMLEPVVGFNAVGFRPTVRNFTDGVQLSVQAVISADRRFVRLTVIPSFTAITDVFTFSFVSAGGAGGPQGLGQLGGQVGGQGGGFGGGFGGGQQGGFGGGGFGGIGGQFGQVGQGGQGGQGGQVGQAGGQVGQAGGSGNVTVQQPVQEIITVLTVVSVPDGGTVLLGGVKRLREGRNMAGVPILNKIPYISRLFKNTGVGRETESLMLMVTPRIIIQEEEEELLGIPKNEQ